VKLQRIQHEFVEFIPQKLEAGRLYVSIEYGTAAHLCACGCGFEVSNPITPTDWFLSFNGQSVSLAPSIGNSNFPCKSHYWIKWNRVVWETKMTPELTAMSRARDKAVKARHFGLAAEPTTAVSPPVSATTQPTTEQVPEKPKSESWLNRLRKLLS
jgi:hypothetical protein